MKNIQSVYGESTYGSSAFGVNTSYSPANIVATSIDVSPSETPCIIGTCTIISTITWQNQGDIPSDFIPSLKIDGNSITSPYSSETLDAGAFTTHSFDITALLTIPGTYTICPDPP